MIIVPREEKEEALDSFYKLKNKLNDKFEDTSDVDLMIEVLETDDETLLDKMSLQGCAYFFRIVNYKYYEEIFDGLLIEIFSSGEDEIMKTYIKTNLIPSIKLNDEEFLDLVLSQNDEILDCFKYYKFDNTSLDVLTKILNQMRRIDVDLFINQCDSKKAFISQNPEYSKQIVSSEKFVDKVRYIEAPYLKKMYLDNKEIFESFSDQNKVTIVENITDSKIQKEFFDIFELSKYIDNLPPKLIELLDKEAIMRKIYEGDYKFVSSLSDDEQFELLSDDRIDKEALVYYLSLNVIIKNIDYNPSIVPLSLYLFNYQNGRNIKLEEYLKKTILSLDSIDDPEVVFKLFNSSLFKTFSEEEIDSIISKIKNIDNPFDILNNSRFFMERKYYDKIAKKLLENADFSNFVGKIQITLSELYKYPQEYREDIIKHIDKNYLVCKSLVDDEEFKLLQELLEWDNNYLNDEDFKKSYVEDIKEKVSFDEKYLFLKNYLSEEQIANLFFSNGQYIKESRKIKSDFIKAVKSNPEYLKSVGLAIYLPKEMHHDILINYQLDKFIETMSTAYTQFIDKSIVDDRYDEIIDYINLHSTMTCNVYTIYLLFSDDNKNRFFKDISLDFSFYFYKCVLTEDMDKHRVFNELFSSQDKILDITYNMLFNFNGEEYDRFFEIASLANIIKACLVYTNDKLKGAVIDKISNNLELLFDPNVYTQFDSLVLLYNEEEIKFITDEVNDRLSKSKYYSSINDIDNLSLASKISIIYGTTKEYINDDNIDYIKELYSKDKFFFANADLRLFRNDIYSLGSKFISRAIRYPSEANLIVELYDNDREKYIKELFEYIDTYDFDTDVYYELITTILNYLQASKNIIDTTPKSLFEYIISTYLPKDKILSKLKFDKNYLESKEKIIDYCLEKSTDIEESRNYVFAKIFGLNRNIIKNTIDSYIADYDLIIDYLDDDLSNIYISLYQSIEELSSIDEMNKFCSEVKTRYSILDFYKFRDNMKKAYFKLIYKEYTELTPITNKTSIIIDGKEVEVEEYLDNYGMFIHSTCAYGRMNLINNDYFISWQYNPNTKNNGISTSYITNSCHGTPPVAGDGVIFELGIEDSNSIGLYSPYDLKANNYGIGLTSNRKEYYVSLSNLSSYTRHTHNEAVFYRRNSLEYPCIQPISIVIYEDMPDSIKSNSINAYNDFKKHGIDIKLKYINRVKVATNEVAKMAKDIKNYLFTYDLDLLKEIINRYESNICTLEFVEEIDLDNLFITNSIVKLLNDTINYLLSIEDVQIRNIEITRFIEIINEEQYKFDLIRENIGGRAHTFKLNSDDLKKRIKELEKKLVEEYRKKN